MPLSGDGTESKVELDPQQKIVEGFFRSSSPIRISTIKYMCINLLVLLQYPSTSLVIIFVHYYNYYTMDDYYSACRLFLGFRSVVLHL